MQRTVRVIWIVARINRTPRREKLKEGPSLHAAHLRLKAKLMRHAHAIHFMPDLA